MEGIAADLLQVEGTQNLARSILQRSMLAGGRVEAHEFGRNQHSSASAGGLLIGISGTRTLSDELVEPLVKTAAGLIGARGIPRGHDTDPASGDTTWAQSQILLGLLIRPQLVRGESWRINELINRLISFQDRTGGWSLRKSEDPQPIFSFYPALALAQVMRIGICREDAVRNSLICTARHLRAILTHPMPLPEKVIGFFAYERIRSAVLHADLPSLTAQRTESVEACWHPIGGLKLQDQTVVITRQPVWHSITWRPLLYLCLRKWLPPLHMVTAALGGEILANFKHNLCAWPGPVGSVNLGTGSSWASGLALRVVVELAADLRKAGLSADDFRSRQAQLGAEAYRYDVAISFAGADREIAETISQRIKAAGFRVFYDRDYQHLLLGEDLTAYLQSTYFKDSRFAIVLVSRAFAASDWASNWEWRAVLARMREQQGSYILPYVIEEVSLPGLNPTLGYISARDYSAQGFADLVVRKLRSQLT